MEKGRVEWKERQEGKGKGHEGSLGVGVGVDMGSGPMGNPAISMQVGRGWGGPRVGVGCWMLRWVWGFAFAWLMVHLLLWMTAVLHMGRVWCGYGSCVRTEQ